MPQPPDPAVVAELICTSRELVRCAADSVARARLLREHNRGLVASARAARAARAAALDPELMIVAISGAWVA